MPCDVPGGICSTHAGTHSQRDLSARHVQQGGTVASVNADYEYSAFLDRDDVVVVEKPVRLAQLAAIIDRLT